MSGRGPRLGKLAGLKREDDDDDPQAKQRRPANKGGIKVCANKREVLPVHERRRHNQGLLYGGVGRTSVSCCALNHSDKAG